jgi:outer membrane protein W
MRFTRLSLLMSTGIFCLCVASTPVASDSAGEPVELRKHGDWWLGLDAGAGAIHLELPEGKVSENKFYLGFRAEYVLSPGFLLGIEASGWLIQPGEIEYNTNPPPFNYESQIEGEGLAPVLLTARYYPWDDSSWYLKAGAGYVSHWQTNQGVTDRESGAGAMFGGGYDFVINQSWDINAFISYSTGSAGDEDYDAITLALGFNYKFRRK